jgi:retron-type reverse transcriptase
MKTYTNLYSKVYSYDNLELALSKARKRKTHKRYVIKFEAEREKNLKQLQYELWSFTYSPRPLTNFIIRDPKTRKISASDFRDRVVYHAICNIITPIFEKNFIYDSFANQKGKGFHNAIIRFEEFARKVCFIDCRTIKLGGGVTI